MQNSIYQKYIELSRYARYLPKEKRRETWAETTKRLIDFFKNSLEKKQNFKLSEKDEKDLYEAILNKEVMPSMRALMVAGKAAERDNTAIYNCSAIAIDDQKAFDEAMYLLMCGCGVGFSVERQYINKLPEIPEVLYKSETKIMVEDSKEGWAKALRQLIALLYSGEIPQWDTHKVRPAGARLKTFGGRASGPEPLSNLFDFTVNLFKNAKNRKLNSLECHDLMCKIAEIVVCGGVRRSAMISLSNLSDDRMRHAKSGQWWELNPQRALANNSVAYTEKPDSRQFLQEWLSLLESQSGERGIFNRQGAQHHVKSNGRRKWDVDFLVNPCSEALLNSYQFCNLTEVVIRSDDTEDIIRKKLRLAAILGTIQSTFTHFPYLRKIWQRTTEEERLLGVSLTGVCDNKLTNNPYDENLATRLESFKQIVIDTNKEYADQLGIQQSTGCTCIKPSGTVSQLVDSASGIHPRFSKFYYRRIRADIKDPLTNVLVEAGVPYEKDFNNPNAYVFTFAQKAPDGALTRDDYTAIDHLNLWLMYKKHYAEHTISITVNLKDNEWVEAGAFVYKNFDDIVGVSFLPFDGGSYMQAPYEEITEEEYNAHLLKMPNNINWNFIEEEDNVIGTQTLACSGGSCELV